VAHRHVADVEYRVPLKRKGIELRGEEPGMAIRYTLENTNLTRKQAGDAVNLESDIIARYVEQLLPGGRDS